MLGFNILKIKPNTFSAQDIFTNTRPLWHPPGARGIYGGAVIAQCLAAAQQTVPDTFLIHSMHCYFVLAGDSEIPVMYYVEHVREGKSFATRTVQARQRGNCIFTTTLSFVRENSGGEETVSHSVPLPADIEMPTAVDESEEADIASGGSPFHSQRMGIKNDEADEIHTKSTRQWIKAKGKISPEGGFHAHLSAMAYMSDNLFIGTVSRVHGLWRWYDRPASSQADAVKQMKVKNKPEVGMMVSLDHSIYFHEPRKLRADEWMWSEMRSPWSGDGRGVVTQSIHAMDGTLIATCFQEVCLLSLGDRGGGGDA
jgi:acyl-CoA thioesterase 8